MEIFINASNIIIFALILMKYMSLLKLFYFLLNKTLNIYDFVRLSINSNDGLFRNERLATGSLEITIINDNGS